jgi:hypothetical protein
VNEKESIAALLKELDNPAFDEQEEPWEKLRAFGSKVAGPAVEAFPKFRSWQGKATLLLRMTRYARTEPAAYDLGLLGCKDVNPIVRTRGCAVLAYSLRDDALPVLDLLLGNRDRSVVEAATAAIDAIRARNHHYFLDRTHSGKNHWDVEKE